MIALTETERVVVRRTRKSVVIDTETAPIFKGKTTPHQIQDVLFYEYMNSEVIDFIDLLGEQEIIEEEVETEDECPSIEVKELEQSTANCDYQEETIPSYALA